MRFRKLKIALTVAVLASAAGGVAIWFNLRGEDGAAIAAACAEVAVERLPQVAAVGQGPTAWERYRGGSPEAEQAVFERLAEDIQHIQARLKQKSGASRLARTLHAKSLLAVTNARFEISEDVAEDLQVGFIRPARITPRPYACRMRAVCISRTTSAIFAVPRCG